MNQTVWMLPLSMIVELADTVGADGCSRVGDAVAARWGSRPGDVRWVRSSANHVFVDHQRGVYVRFLPAGRTSLSDRVRMAELTVRFADAGLPVALPVPSMSNDLVVTVDTDIGPVYAMAVREVAGRQLEADELDIEHAARWGRLLGRLHEAGLGGDEQPEAFTGLQQLRTSYPNDAEMMAAVDGLVTSLADLPRGPSTFGFVHGDFELDNVTWIDSEPVVYDFDGAGRSWFVADIVFATRDLTEGTGVPVTEYEELFRAFVDGYRVERPSFDENELVWAPLFARMHAANSIAALADVIDLGEVGTDETDWVDGLRKRISAHLVLQRSTVLGAP